MQSYEPMDRVFDLIDERISQELTASELADAAGYSFYHFCHLFKSCSGLPVGMYLRKRRLELAATELRDGSTVTDAAMKYGFETHSGFTKAFRKQYGISPSEYRSMKGGFINMTPEIKKIDAFSAVGYCLAPPEGGFEVLSSGAYWLGKDFSSVSKEDYAKLNTPNLGEIGAWINPDKDSGAFKYFFGPKVNDKSFVPAGMEAIDVPAAAYAVFAVPAAASIEELNAGVDKVMKSIFTTWLDTSGYVLEDGKFVFEYYLGEDTFIYVPVVEK